MVLTAIMLNVWGDPTMKTATDVRSVPSSSLLNQMNTAAILWMGRCFAKLAIWAWFLASTNTGLTARDKLQLMKKCHKSGFKAREGRLCMCILKTLEYKHYTSFSNRTMMKYGFFLFFFTLYHAFWKSSYSSFILDNFALNKLYKMHQMYLCNRLCKNIRQTLFEFL